MPCRQWLSVVKVVTRRLNKVLESDILNRYSPARVQKCKFYSLAVAEVMCFYIVYLLAHVLGVLFLVKVLKLFLTHYVSFRQGHC